MSDELWRRGAGELAALIRDREVSSVEVVQAHLDRIEAVNPTLNAVTVVLGDALSEARRADHRAPVRRAARGAVHGEGEHRRGRHGDHLGGARGGGLPAGA